VLDRARVDRRRFLDGRRTRGFVAAALLTEGVFAEAVSGYIGAALPACWSDHL
jgi:hypothetical protein